jgi:hypothetical protein
MSSVRRRPCVQQTKIHSVFFKHGGTSDDRRVVVVLLLCHHFAGVLSAACPVQATGGGLGFRV